MRVAAIALFAVVLLVSGAAGWLFFSDHEAPEAVRARTAAQARIEALRREAASGRVEAQYALGTAFRDGDGIGQDVGAALGWFRAAAERGHPPAQYALGQIYEKGLGVRENLARAAEWYELAGGPGRHVDAQYAFGMMRFRGQGVMQDHAEALPWFRRAAAQGHAAAQYLLGSMYERGWGVKPDAAEAYVWYSLAMRRRDQALAVDGGYDPEPARMRVAAGLGKTRLAEAEARVQAWRANR